MKKHIGIIAPVSIVSVTLLSGTFLLSTKTHADDTVSTATITVPVACTMSGTGTDSHTATIPNGTVQENIGTTTMKVYCNDSEGFSIYAAGFSDNTLGNTYLRDATLGASDDILTGTTFTGTSQWAMKIGATSGTYPSTIAGSAGDSEAGAGDTDYSTWAAIPSSYTRVAYRNSGTDVNNESAASAEGSSITATYKAFINSTQKAGTYIGKVKFTMVHPASEEPLSPQTATSGCINYFPNGSNVEGTMGCQSISNYATSATLLASNFSREGYGFAGWSDKYDYGAGAHFYGPQEDIAFTAGQYTGNNDGLALYAVWVKSAGDIQDWNGCDGLASGAVTALTDKRDNETYAVAKLADGNCWMIENLRLESTAFHNSDGTLAQGYGTSTTYGNFSGLAESETADKFSSTYSANSLYSNDGSNDTINIGTGNYPAYRMPRYNNVNTPTDESDRPQNPTANNSTNNTSNAGMYSYGNYYTWHAAIADLDPNTINNQSITSTSLCPTGWHLPTSGGAYASGSTTEVNKTGSPSTYREFYNLGYKIMNEVKTAYEDISNGDNSYYSSATINTAGDTATKAFRKYPNNFVYSGFMNNGSVGELGDSGGYWSSTASYTYGVSYGLYLLSGPVYPGTADYSSYSGKSIRCLVSGV